MSAPAPIRHWVVVLGDQLDRHSSAFDGFDPAQDRVWMCEAREEATHVLSSRIRTAVFLSAMRHHAEALRAEGLPLHYQQGAATLHGALAEALAAQPCAGVVVAAPGDWRVLQALRETCAAAGVPLDVREDRHFLCSVRDFFEHARGKKQLRMEFFYRWMRQREGVLMETDAAGKPQPVGGQWNFDADNRNGFPPQGPGFVPAPLRFAPDATTQAVLDEVAAAFPDTPGDLRDFGWPVTRAQALQVLDDFIAHRLADFGTWQDAMWEGEPWLYHSHLSVALNLKLLHPREAIAAAEAAWRRGDAPLNAVEGFIRQILGWREYVRGIYWRGMPGYAERNELGATEALPAWFWTGDVPMACLRDAITQTLRWGYAHHIQRLMVTGLYTLLLGVDPAEVHRWYLAVYVDAVEWVELPNTLGMSQYADGGEMASKPYVATGQYIDRMSNHCAGCRFKPTLRTGPQACPYTTLYWDFLLRHEDRFARHPRMALQVKNLARLGPDERTAITRRAAAVRRDAWDEA